MTEQRDLAIPTILFLNVETSGLYRADLPMDDDGQPWAMQISAALSTPTGVFTNHFSHIIASDGRKVKEGAFEKHGITAQAAARIGVPEKRVLGILADMLKTAPPRAMKVVTYGDHDHRIISSLFARFAVAMGHPSTAYDNLWLSRPAIEFVDLQKPYCQELCELTNEPNVDGYRWPRLAEAIRLVLGREPKPGYSDAWEDVLAIRDIYLEIERRGLFKGAPNFAGAT